MRFICILFLSLTLFASLEVSGEVIRSEKHSFKVESLVEGLQKPWGLVKLPDGRFLVTEKVGRVRIIEEGKLLDAAVANIPTVNANGQGGLLDIELHPDYKNNGWIYLAFSKPSGTGAFTSIVRGRLRDHAFVDKETVYEPPVEDYTQGGNHFGCRMEFDLNNYLYFSIGDRGDTTKPENRAQKLTHAAGKTHRIHDDGKIPKDNPFVDVKGARPSIWSYGNRNAQGLKFQPSTGLLWETEHGPRGGDELNIIRKGLNYGWPIITYGLNYSGTTITEITEKEGMEQPVIYWTPSIAVSGMDFYEGAKFPNWKGDIFIGALAHQKLVRVVVDKDSRVTHQEMLLEKSGRIRDVRCFDDGFIYVIYDEPGKIVRLVPE
ncbi:MAG: PQQ-dependent sugar dehydrogenase [Blastochloris sp.]|nr:PQQ-dependent sugar dehydrogenase [Blastochloris sp.]